MIPVESIVRYLIKFGSEKNMKSLLDGKVFMHNLQYYINLEKEKGDQITGDEYEGKLPVVNVTLSIRNPDTHEEITQISCGKASFDFGMSKYPVYCTLMFDHRNMLNDEEPQVPKEGGDPYTILRYGFTEDQKKEMATFGDSAVFIKNVDEFIHRVRKAAEAKGIQVGYGPVSYYHDNELKHHKQVMEQHGAAPLWKRDRYKNQQEYRIYLDTEIDDSMILEIGDIRDIAELLPTTVLLDSELCVKAILEPLHDNP